MKVESRVIADQHAAVKKFTSFVQTARQASRQGFLQSLEIYAFVRLIAF